MVKLLNIEQLQRLGYFISYDEVMHYKQAVVDRSPQMSLDNDCAFLQWILGCRRRRPQTFNQVTLTRKDPFHGMRVITANY